MILGENVTWTSRDLVKTGKILSAVPANTRWQEVLPKFLNMSITEIRARYNLNGLGNGVPRKQLSYLVVTPSMLGGRELIYWPNMATIKSIQNPSAVGV